MNPRLRIGVWLAVLLALVIVIGPALLPWGPNEQLALDRFVHQRPSLAHPLGTDAVARDVLARTLAGARVSLAVAIGAVVLALAIGTTWGVTAGLSSRRTDTILMRIVDAFASVPRVLLLLGLLASVPRVPLPWLIVILGTTSWFTIARLVRAEVRTLRDQDFVVAARALGDRTARIATRHLWPHLAPLVLAAGAVSVADVILLEAGLSWLGIGVQPPTASWGNIIRDGFEFLETAPWVWIAPGTCLVAVVLAVNLCADGLRNAAQSRHLPAS
jgi:peptide/nickel transport system permease protein